MFSCLKHVNTSFAHRWDQTGFPFSLFACLWRRWSMKQTGTETEKWTSRSSCALWRKPACTEGSAWHQGCRVLVFTCNAAHISTSVLKSLLLCRAIHFHLECVFICRTERKLFKTFEQKSGQMPNYPPLIYLIIYITFAKKQKEKSPFLVWNAAYVHEEYADNVKDDIWVICCQEILSAYVNMLTNPVHCTAPCHSSF